MHCPVSTGDTWQVVQMMAFGEFEMVDVDRFNLKVFPGKHALRWCYDVI